MLGAFGLTVPALLKPASLSSSLTSTGLSHCLVLLGSGLPSVDSAGEGDGGRLGGYRLLVIGTELTLWGARRGSGGRGSSA